MLSRYDDFPVHQTARPVHEVSQSAAGFSDGYFFSVYSAEEAAYLFLTLRVHPNLDLVGAATGLGLDGHQRTVRLSRRWRPDCETTIGPLTVEFVEPMQRIRLRLDDPGAGLGFDVEWQAAAEPYEEAHHHQVQDGRLLHDQHRYCQAGRASGSITIDGRTLAVEPATWGASRDHSWGLYYEAAPIAPRRDLLPPPTSPVGTPRALRLWTFVTTPSHAGFIARHEDADGLAPTAGGHLTTPVDGALDGVELTDVGHELRLSAGDKLLEGGTVTAVDADGGEWRLDFDIAAPPWLLWPLGGWIGGWRDGGTWQTWHGEGVSVEWDDFDVSHQPMDHQGGEGLPLVRRTRGIEHVAGGALTAPDGTTEPAVAHVEFWVDGVHHRYGFDDPTYRALGEGM
ncbi:MAG: hypothetical protein H0W25_15440 [Acidimicrobiia bacterium]|nr:hypothetical protein [Acidimicrobiia bacterium]